MAEALARRVFAGRNLDVDVRSAGLSAGGFPSTTDAQIVMAEHGLDISKHESTFLGDALETLPDLILAMESGHVRKIERIDPALADRTFTLKGFVRLGKSLGPRKDGETLDDYLLRVSASGESKRREDTIPDPIGMGLLEYERCAGELKDLVGALAELV